MLLILSPQNSPRLDYVCHVIFKLILNLDYAITQNEQTYQQHQDFKLRYLPKSNILFEKDIRPQDENLLLQDKPALAFFLLSNYEEYLPDCPRDKHGRIVHEQSFVVKHKLYSQAVVHRIALKYKELLIKQKPSFQWKERKYRFVPTFDVDIAYAFKGKSFGHFCGALVKSLLKGKIQNAKNILNARFSKDFNDPYDLYENEKALCTQHQVKPRYFVLACRRTLYDRNISPQTPVFDALIQQLQSFADIGLHTSYYAENLNDILQQKKTLENKTQTRIFSSRQHFLKEKMPQTFQNLIAAGISDDFSLGFYDRIGFRNGMAVPFPFFDLKKEEKTELTLHPLLFMDSAAIPTNFSETDYWKNLQALIQEVQTMGGEMTALWHNNFMPKGSKEEALFKASFEKMAQAALI